MAVAFTAFDSFANTAENDTSIATTNSKTVTSGRLYVVGVGSANTTTQADAVTLSGWGITWTTVGTETRSTTRRVTMFAGIAPGGATGVLTVESTANMEALLVHAVEVTGFDSTSAAIAMGQFAVTNNATVNIATGLTVTLTPFTRDGSGGAICFSISSKNQVSAADAAASELYDAGVGTPVLALHTQVQTTENTTIDVFPSSDATGMAMIAAEIRATPAAAVSVPTMTMTNGTTNWGLTGFNANSFYSLVTHKGALYAAGRQDSGGTNPDLRLLRSIDGRSWSAVATGIGTGNEIRRLWSGSDGYLYAGIETSTPTIYRSLDGLSNWTAAWTSDDAAGDNYPRDFQELGTRIYCAIKGNSAGQGRIIRSDAGPDGSTFAVAIDDIASATNVQLLQDSTNLFIFTDAPAVYKTTDGTTLGARIDASTQWASGTNILHSPVKWGSNYWVGSQNTTRGCALYKSTDACVTWRRQTEYGLGAATPAQEEELYALKVVSIAGTDYLLVGTYNQTSGGSVYITGDGITLTRIGTQGFASPAGTYQGVFQFSPPVNGKVFTSSRVTAVSDTTQTFPTTIEPTSAGMIAGGISLSMEATSTHDVLALTEII